jgi:hypothetical protein
MTLARDLFAALPEESRAVLLRHVPADCAPLRDHGVSDTDAVILKLVEVRAFEVGSLDKGFELTVDDKIELYSTPILWASLVDQLVQLSETVKYPETR